jgi:hypothetical protein
VRLAFILLAAGSLAAQTQIDWTTQIKNKPFVNPEDYYWSRTYGIGASGNLSSSGSGKVITLTPGPKGITAYSSVRIYGGTGTAEWVFPTATTCSASAVTASCSITVTTAQAHTGAWIAASATAGIGEAASTTGATVDLKSATYNIYGPLVIAKSDVTLRGNGPGASLIRANHTNGDVLRVGTGPGTDTVLRVTLEGFRVDAASALSSPYAGVHLWNVGRSQMENVWAAGQDGTMNLYHGFWLDGVDTILVRGYQNKATGDAMRVNGYVGVGQPKAGVYIMQGRLMDSAVGLRVGGAMGGLAVDHADIIGNVNNMVIDQTLAAESNRELFFGNAAQFDSSQSDSVVISDGLNNGTVTFTGSWIASAGQLAGGTAGSGLLIESTVANPTIVISGGTIFNCKTDGIRNESDTAQITITGTALKHNTGYAINNTSTANPIELHDIYTFSNTAGNVNGLTVNSHQGNISFKAGAAIRQIFVPNPNTAGTETTGGSAIVFGTGNNGVSDETAPPLNGTTFQGGSGVIARGFTDSAAYQGSLEFWTKYNNTAGRRMLIKRNGVVNMSNTPVYADNAAAISGGLAVGDTYRTPTGVLMQVYAP